MCLSICSYWPLNGVVYATDPHQQLCSQRSVGSHQCRTERSRLIKYCGLPLTTVCDPPSHAPQTSQPNHTSPNCAQIAPRMQIWHKRLPQWLKHALSCPCTNPHRRRCYDDIKGQWSSRPVGENTGQGSGPPTKLCPPPRVLVSHPHGQHPVGQVSPSLAQVYPMYWQ